MVEGVREVGKHCVTVLLQKYNNIFAICTSAPSDGDRVTSMQNHEGSHRGQSQASGRGGLLRRGAGAVQGPDSQPRRQGQGGAEPGVPDARRRDHRADGVTDDLADSTEHMCVAALAPRLLILPRPCLSFSIAALSYSCSNHQFIITSVSGFFLMVSKLPGSRDHGLIIVAYVIRFCLSIPGHRLSCSDPAGCKRSLRCADPGEYHEVRCCSDARIEGWHRPDTACPYIEPETFTKLK